MIESVSVVGLGKLGMGLALCFASAGLKTLGVDVNQDVINAISARTSPIVEPGYQELLNEVGDRLTVTSSHYEAIKQTDITFVLVATPSTGDGRFSNRHVKSALRSLAKAFGKSKKPYHLFVISSTVIPGSTDTSFIPILEQHSGKKLNIDFGMCYNPDFVALGSVLRDFRNPELILIGESTSVAGENVAAIYQRVCQNRPVIQRMSIISAEVAKVSLNTYVTMKISFANTLANICEKIPGADIDAITNAIGVDRRISPYYLKGGLGYAGTCFPRDTRAFITFAQQSGNEAELIKAVERVNAYQHQHLVDVVRRYVSHNKRVSILGLSFKANTPVIEESPAIKLIQALLCQDTEIVVYDVLAMQNVKAIFSDKIKYAESARDCLMYADIGVIALQVPEYKQAAEELTPRNPVVIIDCWRVLDRSLLSQNILYVPIGRASDMGNNVL